MYFVCVCYNCFVPNSAVQLQNYFWCKTTTTTTTTKLKSPQTTTVKQHKKQIMLINPIGKQNWNLLYFNRKQSKQLKYLIIELCSWMKFMCFMCFLSQGISTNLITNCCAGRIHRNGHFDKAVAQIVAVYDSVWRWQFDRSNSISIGN